MRKMIFAAAFLAAGPALAGPTCTDAAQDTWLTEDKMKTMIAEQGFTDISLFKVTTGNCYEIYGIASDDTRVEVYFHPVTGEVVKREEI